MLVEDTVLNEKIIKQILHRHYGMEAVKVEKLLQNTANCYRVCTDKGCVFLKEFPSSFTKTDIDKEAAFVDFLAGALFPVARFFTASHGEKCIEYDKHLITLQEFVEGKTYFNGEFSPAHLSEAAKMLGKLHKTASNYPLSDDKFQKWVDDLSAEASINRIDKLLSDIDKKPFCAHSPEITLDLQYKKEAVLRAKKYAKYFDDVTFSVVHGDYQGCQLIFDGDGKVRAVIDFSLVRRAPLVWEIMRSYVFTSPSVIKKSEIDVEELKNYVREYIRYNPIDNRELRAMPYIYITTLIHQMRGYELYLKNGGSDGERILKSAAAATSVCRDIEKKAEEIAKALVSL